MAAKSPSDLPSQDTGRIVSMPDPRLRSAKRWCTRETTTPWLQNHRDLPSQDTGRILFMPNTVSPEIKQIIITASIVMDKNTEAQICKEIEAKREATTPWLQNHRYLPSQDTDHIISMPDPVSPDSSSLSSLPQWIKTEKINQHRESTETESQPE